MAPPRNMKPYPQSCNRGPQPPLAFMFFSLWDTMLIRAETAGQSRRIHGRKAGLRDGERKSTEKRRGKEKRGRKKSGGRGSWEGKVKIRSIWKRMPPAVHSRITLLWTRDPKTSLKGEWVGQWSACNREQAEANFSSHKGLASVILQSRRRRGGRCRGTRRCWADD